ncbi:hypothetical protein AAMO2058_001535200 [Amorphochlora amoebiformis]
MPAGDKRERGDGLEAKIGGNEKARPREGGSGLSVLPAAKRLRAGMHEDHANVDPDSALGDTKESPPSHPFARYVVDIKGYKKASAQDVGIKVFRTPGKRFTAVFKHRYSDFIVEEVGLDKKIVTIPEKDPKEAKGMEVEEKVTPNLETAKKELGPLIGAERAQALVKFVESGGTVGATHVPETTSTESKEEEPNQGNKNQQKKRGKRKRNKRGKQKRGPSFVVEGMDDKDIRTKVHMVVRNHLKGFDSSTTPTKGVEIFKGSSGRRPKKKRPYLHFTLLKKKIDTMSAINSLCRIMRLKPKTFSFAGTKDRRAITLQRVCGFGLQHKHLFGTVEKWLNKSMRVGHFEYKDTGLKLGELYGNRFSIILREVEGITNAALKTTAESIRKNGFVNYYGMQRFGTGTVSTHAVGLELLKGNIERAIGLILAPRPEDKEDSSAAKKIFRDKGDIEETLRLLPRFMHNECNLLQALNELGPSQPLPALKRIQRGMRLMYMHSVQSMIWNHMASIRMEQMNSSKALPGDLVYRGDDEAIAMRRDQGLPEVIMLDEKTAGNYSIFDIILPTPGSDVVIPSNLKSSYLKILKEYAIESLIDSNQSPRYDEAALTGNYRKLICRPKDLEIDIITYTKPDQCLIDSEYLVKAEEEVGDSVTSEQGEHIQGDQDILQEPSGEKTAIKLRFTLPSSSYATIAIRELTKTSVRT